jgi:hypothetical protein
VHQRSRVAPADGESVSVTVHIYGTPTEATDALEHDEALCDDDRDEEELGVVFHTGAVATTSGGWCCFVCGFSTIPVDGTA